MAKWDGGWGKTRTHKSSRGCIQSPAHSMKAVRLPLDRGKCRRKMNKIQELNHTSSLREPATCRRLTRTSLPLRLQTTAANSCPPLSVKFFARAHPGRWRCCCCRRTRHASLITLPLLLRVRLSPLTTRLARLNRCEVILMFAISARRSARRCLTAAAAAKPITAAETNSVCAAFHPPRTNLHTVA